MTPERLAEIRRHHDEVGGASNAEVGELLDHITQLDTQRGEPDLYVYHHSPLTYDVFEDRETAESIARTGLGELIPVWKSPQRSVAVVAPGIMLSDISDECAAMPCNDREAFLRGALWSQRFISERIQPIPASQVLQPGEVRVDAREIAIYRNWEKNARADGDDSIRFDEMVHLRELDALRSQAGGEG